MKFIFSLIILLSLSFRADSSDDHGHEKEGHKHKKEEKGHDHKEEHDHEEEKHEKDKEQAHEDHKEHKEGEDGHAHEDEHEKPASKGIIEANEKNGFKLSEKAIKNFELVTSKINGKGPWVLPVTAIIYSGKEINLYRLRSGFFKRIDFHEVKKNKKDLSFTSIDVQESDEIVIKGGNFLRIAELAAFGGVEHGHSH